MSPCSTFGAFDLFLPYLLSFTSTSRIQSSRCRPWAYVLSPLQSCPVVWMPPPLKLPFPRMIPWTKTFTRLPFRPQLANPYSPIEDDPSKEECQEGYSVLPDGLWCFRHWYVAPCENRCDDSYNGLTAIEKINQTYNRQAVPPLSTHSAERAFSIIRSPTMLAAPTLRMVSRSSPSLSVRTFNYACMHTRY